MAARFSARTLMMASSSLAVARRVSVQSTRRHFSSARVLRSEAIPNLGTPPAPKRPVGGIRGGIIGFLAGFSLASSYAVFRLLDEYKEASVALQASVEELQKSSEKISAHVRRIETVEKDLKALSDASSSKADLSRLRAEVKKIYDGLHIEFLDLRTFVWGLQQDVHSLTKVKPPPPPAPESDKKLV